MTANNAPEKTATIDIKLPALLAGTATSVVVAVLASRLGVQGTLIGAAFTSLVFGVLSPFLTFGIERTHHGLKLVAARRRPSDSLDQATAGPESVLVAEPGRRISVGAVLAGIVATAVVTFAATIAVVTAVEATAGRSVDGAHTTTVAGVANPGTSAPDGTSLNVQQTVTPSPMPTVTVTVTPSAPGTETPLPGVPDTTPEPQPTTGATQETSPAPAPTPVG